MSRLQSAEAPRLLVVSNEPSDRSALGQWLQGAGYRVVVTDGAKAQARLMEHDYTLVVLSTSAVAVLGSDRFRLVDQGAPATVVLAATGAADSPEAIRAAVPQASTYIAAPICVADVLAQVWEVVRQRRIVVAVNRFIGRLLQDGASDEQVIRRLIRATSHRDDETGSHVERTGLYSGMLAARLGWDADRVDAIRLAAPLHDIGKLSIPDVILRKPGRFGPRELFAMQAHSFLGARMLAGFASQALRMAHEIALWHHERWDGRGYPFGLAGPAIPESARIVGLVDVFDALTHDRVYRRALPHDNVLRVLHEGRGTHFDPSVLDAFLTLLPVLHGASPAWTTGDPARAYGD